MLESVCLNMSTVNYMNGLCRIVQNFDVVNFKGYIESSNIDGWRCNCHLKSNKKFDWFNFDCLIENHQIIKILHYGI